MLTTVTAFDTFGGSAANSSEVAVREFARLGGGSTPGHLNTLVLPTTYHLADHCVRALLQHKAPDLLLMMGMASGAGAVLVETRARNLDACPEPDNAGEVRLAEQLRPDGPEFYSATIDVGALYYGLRALGIPALISDDAGGFVCNHAFYVARHEIELAGLPTRCGFVHLPAIDEGAITDGVAATARWSTSALVRVLRVCINVLVPGPVSDGMPPEAPRERPGGH
jgi:pyroglutamyl-peptidase